MTLKQLQEARLAKIAAMGKIQEKGDAIQAVDLNAMKTFKDEISLIDDQIEAIELTRAYAVKKSKSPKEKEDDFSVVQRESFSALLRGSISFEAHKQKIMAVVGSHDVAKGKELVPDEFMRILKERVLEYGIIVPNLDRVTTSNHGVLSYPTMDDTANSALWLDEHGTIDLKDFATGTIELNAFKLGTGIVVSNELVEDSFFDILVYSANLIGIRIARTLEASVINGDGVKKPLGILNTALITGTVKAIVSVDTATTVVFAPEDLEALIDSVQPSQRMGSTFYLSDSAMRAATKWKDTTGRKLLQMLSTSTDSSDVIYEFGGYPISVNYELGDVTSVADTIAFFGNVKNYTLRVVRDVTVKASDQVNFLTDETVVIGTMRVDGRVTSTNVCFSKLVVAAV